MIERLLHLFFPEVCQFCRARKATKAEQYLCQTCRASDDGIRAIEPPFCQTCGLPARGEITNDYDCANCAEFPVDFSKARAAVRLTDLMLEAIVSFKYSDALWYEPFLAGLLVQAAAGDVLETSRTAIIPVPLHPSRQRKRGMNQAEVLARHLSKATGVAVQSNVLLKTVQNDSQTRMSREERRENVKGAFSLKKNVDITGWRVVLVDDVLTTGATASECARVLLKSGAADVTVWTVARTVHLR